MRVVLFVLSVFGSVFAYGQSKKTIHSTIPTNNIRSVIFNIQSENAGIELRPTKSSRILVETTIEIDIDNPNLLEFAANTRRYDLIQQTNSEKQILTLSAKADRNVIVTKGKQIKEFVHYVIYLPENLDWADLNESQTAMSASTNKNGK